jgi:hypothetical protein
MIIALTLIFLFILGFAVLQLVDGGKSKAPKPDPWLDKIRKGKD